MGRLTTVTADAFQQEGRQIAGKNAEQRQGKSLGNDPVSMNAMRPDLLDVFRSRGKQSKKEKWNDTPLPGSVLQISKNATILHQSFHCIGAVAEAMNGDSIQHLLSGRSGRMRTNHLHLEVVDKTPIQFMNETGFMIPAPPRIGGRKDQKSMPDCR